MEEVNPIQTSNLTDPSFATENTLTLDYIDQTSSDKWFLNQNDWEIIDEINMRLRASFKDKLLLPSKNPLSHSKRGRFSSKKPPFQDIDHRTKVDIERIPITSKLGKDSPYKMEKSQKAINLDLAMILSEPLALNNEVNHRDMYECSFFKAPFALPMKILLRECRVAPTSEELLIKTLLTLLEVLWPNLLYKP